MAPAFRLDRPPIRALLGPTNTGKTHYAMERLLSHASGMIGFPLRLLARENYERLVARKGADQVALITGEEKIVPANARWFACTVEAMPLDRPVACIAVDEIQLCADPDRGHVFTDRLLHARGIAETLFLGAETMAPMLRHLVPEAEVDTRPRLSRLSHAGHVGIDRLPPRSAVVAFAASEVYAIAEAIRRRRGGCAIVMGRLSPRTRNAQVALFQSGEVDFLVATDAIGMGLNMDVDHVGFAGLSKFDGRALRRLAPQEVAQIAGRAGRGMRDGTFGTVGDAPTIAPELADQVEEHRFDPLASLSWRNSQLDFASIDSLMATLAQPPPTAVLRRTTSALDHATLLGLARESAVRDQVRRRADVIRLWEACQIPDFRKLGDESHARLCARIFQHLARPPHRLPVGWIRASLEDLARTEGDVDTLMQRLAGVRVWAYVASRPDWLADAAHWQAQARGIEDRLSDALHQSLMARFVDRRAAHLARRLGRGEPQLLATVSAGGAISVEGHSVGRMHGFRFQPDEGGGAEAARLLMRAARRALATEIRARVARLEAAGDADFRLDPPYRILWREGDAARDPDPWPAVARLRPGPTPGQPAMALLASDLLDGEARGRIQQRVGAWLRAHVAATLAPLAAAAARAPDDPAIRGLLHQLEETLGIVPIAAIDPARLPAPRQLRRAGIVLGRFACFVPGLLKPAAMRLRAALLGIADGTPWLALPAPGLVSVAADGPIPAPAALRLGWQPAGPLLVRLDVAERIAADLAFRARREPQPVPPDLAARLGCRQALLPAVLRGLGFVLQPGADGQPLCRPRRPKARAEPGRSPAPAAHPAFAVLQTLRR